MVYYGSSDASACIVGRSTIVTAYDVNGDSIYGAQFTFWTGGYWSTDATLIVTAGSGSSSITLEGLKKIPTRSGSYFLVVTDPSTGDVYQTTIIGISYDEDDGRIIDYLSLMADPDDPQSALSTD